MTELNASLILSSTKAMIECYT